MWASGLRSFTFRFQWRKERLTRLLSTPHNLWVTVTQLSLEGTIMPLLLGAIQGCLLLCADTADPGLQEERTGCALRMINTRSGPCWLAISPLHCAGARWEVRESLKVLDIYLRTTWVRRDARWQSNSAYSPRAALLLWAPGSKSRGALENSRP